MELHIDLLKNDEKAIPMIILGLFSLCSLVLILIWRSNVHTWHYAPVFDGILYGIVFLIGITFTFVGFGFSFAKFFGKAFIIIDKEKISVKTKVFVKQQIVQWDDIKSMKWDLRKYYIVKNKDEEQIIDLSKLDYYILKDIMTTITGIAKEKGLVINEKEK